MIDGVGVAVGLGTGVGEGCGVAVGVGDGVGVGGISSTVGVGSGGSVEVGAAADGSPLHAFASIANDAISSSGRRRFISCLDRSQRSPVTPERKAISIAESEWGG